MPDAHQDESDGEDDDEGSGEREDCVSPVDARALCLGGRGDGVLVGDGTHPLHEFGFREVASGTRGSALAEDENLARARRFRLPVRCMKERQDAGSKFKPRKRA